MKAAVAWAVAVAPMALVACQPAPQVAAPPRKAIAEADAERSAAKIDNHVTEETETAVAIAGVGPPLVVVSGRSAKIAYCLQDKLAAHPGLNSMGLSPTAPRRLANGAYRLQPEKAIRIQLGANEPKTSNTELIGRMTYSTTVAPAGGNRTAIYFAPEAPDLSGTVLQSLLETVRKQTHRQARVCAL